MDKIKKTWRRDYGDGYETDDSVLWINGQPTDHCVSQSSGVFYAFIDGSRAGFFDSLKEAKEFILSEI